MVVPPGTDWPGDRATADTPVATTGEGVARLAASASTVGDLDARSSVCRACPRLVTGRETVAAVKRRAFHAETYWGRPVPGFGDPSPRLLIVGLAPAAHGANRTGRNFTGDRSGDFLFAALHRLGVANQPTSIAAGDGLRLTGVRIVAPVRCAPPANKPTPVEQATCRPWLIRELDLVWPTVRSVLVLGGIGWSAVWPALHAAGVVGSARLPAPFGHGVQVDLPDDRSVFGCYHVSQQNTFTGRLTPDMLDAVLARALAR